ncbi:MAG: hypothetical protein LBG13_02035, partial [Holosporales bacterium]|nr:hypothetical protein [Holosporales bacterium]
MVKKIFLITTIAVVSSCAASLNNAHTMENLVDSNIEKLMSPVNDVHMNMIENNFENKEDEEVKIEYENGNVYEGKMKNGKKEGKGKMVWASGEVKGDAYEGDWKNDAM